MPLINLLAYEAWLIQAIHHEQEIVRLYEDGMSKGYQLQYCIKGSKHYSMCSILFVLFAVSLFEQSTGTLRRDT